MVPQCFWVRQIWHVRRLVPVSGRTENQLQAVSLVPASIGAVLPFGRGCLSETRAASCGSYIKGVSSGTRPADGLGASL